MANPARNVTESEFWRPPVIESAHTTPATQTEACERCGTDFVVGSRFCHLCGTAREPHLTHGSRFSLSTYLDWTRIKDSLSLTTGSLVAFIIGIVCIVGAVSTGIIYTSATVLDWQAVQFWRSEWLLAAIAAFLAGMLLKRTA